MIVNHISSNQSSTYTLDNSLEKWVLDAGITIATTTGNGLYQDENFHDDIIQIDGTIDQTVGHFSGLEIDGSNTDVVIGESGIVNGYIGAHFLEGTHDSFTNYGTISGFSTYAMSIQFVKNFKMVNHGTISDEIFVDRSDKVTITLAKDGTLHTSMSAMDIASDAGQHTKVVNEGLIQADSSWAVYGRDGNETFINHGTMKGGISFGAGDDVFDTRGGKIDSDIDMDAGNDTVLLSKSSYEVTEAIGGGTDTVKADCSYTLATNSEVEYLRLLGTSNFKATGNNLDNHIFGNKANNRIAGLEGTDVLTGGKGADVFVFADGYQTDTVADFHAGTDRIDLSGLTAVTGFKDLMKNHVSISDGNLVITAGTDTLTLDHVGKSDLHAADFVF